jgi:hypothetical protein
MRWPVGGRGLGGGEGAFDAFAAGGVLLQEKQAAFEFADAGEVFFQQDFEDGVDLQLLAVEGLADLLVHSADDAADVGVVDVVEIEHFRARG